MRRQGFTLIELLIVVAIIAILALIAVPNFLEAQTRSKVSRVKADMRSLATAVEAYHVDHKHYPPVTLPAPQLPSIVRLVPLTTPIAYITTVPSDPFNLDVWTGYNPADMRVPVFWAEPWWAAVSQSTKDLIWAEDIQQAQVDSNWFLISYSPDKDFDVNDNGWASTIQYYDPTNGTISDGDVIRSRTGVLGK